MAGTSPVVVATRHAPVLASVVVAVVVALASGACGSDDGSGADDLTGASRSADGAVAVERGVAVAAAQGCTTCHGEEGQGGVGPAWQGLAGSTVELEDGSTVVADAAYLRRSIDAPGADRVGGYTAQMPDLGLSDDDVNALVAYIESLA